ncbi:hypothetical protein CJU90_3842 [Yarrowia sp. C11]|nr:hypothetical protein CKK34_5453 [Yarrowia sp. E02]KAG5367544.1 hypothetical protein CJU90_3842 [Yarrowia sp. C11]
MGDAKRTVQACDLCRQKKSRCCGTRPTCANCLRSGSECVYAAQARKRRRTKLEVMEEKLQVMLQDENCDVAARQEFLESFKQRLLKKRKADGEAATSSGVFGAETTLNAMVTPSTTPPGPTQIQVTQPTTTQQIQPVQIQNEPVQAQPIQTQPIQIQNEAEKNTENTQNTHSLTSSNPFSYDDPMANRPIFCSTSDAGLRWIETQTCDVGFHKRYSHLTESLLETGLNFLRNWRPPSMPSRPVVLNEDILRFLARTFLEAANPYLDIVDDVDVLRVFNVVIETEPQSGEFYPEGQLYHLTVPESLLFHSCVLVSLEIFMDVTRNKNAAELADTILPLEKASAVRDQVYVNAQRDYMTLISGGGGGESLGNTTETSNYTQLSLQACLVFLTSTTASSEPQLMEPLITTCMRLCYQMRLHREESIGFMSRHRTLRNCFWVTYMFEATFLGRLARRPLVRDYDISLLYPESSLQAQHHHGGLFTPKMTHASATNTPCNSWLNPYIRLCRLQSRVCDDLYNNVFPPDTRDPVELLHIASKLDSELQSWRASVPHDLDFEAEYDAVHPIVLEAYAPLHGVHIRPVNIQGLINERCCNAYRFRVRNLGLTLLNCMYLHVTILIHKTFFWYPRWALPVNLSFVRPTFGTYDIDASAQAHNPAEYSSNGNYIPPHRNEHFSASFSQNRTYTQFNQSSGGAFNLPHVDLPSKRVFASNSLVRSSARKICNALTRMDMRYTSFIWIFAFFPTVAFDVLFQTIILTPLDSTTSADLSRMRFCINFMKKLKNSNIKTSEQVFLPIYEQLLAYATGFVSNCLTTNDDDVQDKGVGGEGGFFPQATGDSYWDGTIGEMPDFVGLSNSTPATMPGDSWFSGDENRVVRRVS